MKKDDDSPFWIPVSLESEEAEEKIRSAIATCKVVHEWAMVEMREHWDYYIKRTHSNDLVPKMTQFLEQMGLKKNAQRFSFTAALARAVGRFHKEISVNMGEREPNPLYQNLVTREATIHFPDPYMPTCYEMIDVQSRNIWNKYMTQFDRFSTHYGMVYLEGEWRATLLEQSREMRISPRLVPYLIYSASIREKEEQWQVRFNMHQQNSKLGKKRTSQSWEK